MFKGVPKAALDAIPDGTTIVSFKDNALWGVALKTIEARAAT